MGGVALFDAVPIAGIYTEEEFEVLFKPYVSVWKMVEERKGELRTPIAYVCEQYISPRKKSRNSTG